ncbi:hypothetical protein A1O1_05052 [Capronia coronata CBS 617.96]|uniref:Major facilitator superfamily (MFS) profile domain-containing protein n=1 Tax=Capronia coronata CBS 617.96 TaxID=1182541 RepID=W9Z0S2_9EURO|nr:uncharacterized protein A1O1_05052 [Capronia coronata CBS 617.96]EXJ88124.1 hypothetical protein A1O1_05052 [Capronia coronata CBS 617.96]
MSDRDSDIEKAELPVRRSTDNDTSSSASDISDLEKADTVPDPIPTSRVTPTATAQQSGIWRSRSQATDGFGTYNLEEDDDQLDSILAVQRTPTDAYEVRWDGKDDKLFPRNFSIARKWLIVSIVSLSSFLVTCTSSLYSVTYDQIMDEFHISREVATLGLSTFVLGLAVGPMMLAPLSEFYGRRPIYLASMSMFVIWLVPEAVAQNIGTILVSRFFDGLAGSAFLAVAAGTVVDMFDSRQIAFPMMIYTASPFLGPAAGPIIGGFINEYTSWRWSFYVLLIWSGVLFVTVILFVPETFHKILLKKKAQRKRKETGNDRWWASAELDESSVVLRIIRACYTPVLLLALEPMCLMLCLYSAILLGIVYLLFGAIPLIFRTNHGFELYQNGLAFLGIGIGMLAGVVTNPYWDKNYQRLVKGYEEKMGQKDIQPEPEFRLPPAMAGAILVPIGLFWFGWTTYASVHWIVPIIATAFFGAGVFLAFTGILTFLVDAYADYAASAVGANVLVRLAFAAGFPLFGVQMYEVLGYQWASSLLGFLGLACLPLPFLFFKYGRRIRARSRFQVKT